MEHHFLFGLSSIIIFGIGAQWLAWRLRFPSIIFLLGFGILAGPVFHIVNPDQMFGPTLVPLISISVALILFEGALSLRWKDLREAGPVILSLVMLGAIVTWAIGTAAAFFLLGLNFHISLLLGAILIVTGPTVIMPLLRHVRPSGAVGKILKWEGIVIDPIGAVLAALVFEYVAVGNRFNWEAVVFMFKSLVAGAGAGYLGAWVIVKLLKRFWIPDHLHDAGTLMSVVSVFMVSNLIQPESGLYAVIAMGIFLGNQRQVAIDHIINFKESLGLLIISSLFIILGARLNVTDLAMIRPSYFVFLASLMIVARPLAVFLSTLGSGLNREQKWFMACMAPRGIVAAAIASVFAFELSARHIPQAEYLVPVTFFVIITTVVIYGICAMPLAKSLGLARSNPQGVLIMGAHALARAIGVILKQKGIKAVFIDTNSYNVFQAKQQGLEVYSGNILEDEIRDEIDLEGIGRLLALTPNDEANSLASLYYRDLFGRVNIYQLPKAGGSGPNQKTSLSLRGRLLFSDKATYNDVSQLWGQGAIQWKICKEGEKIDAGRMLPLFLISEDKQLKIFCADENISLKSGWTLVYLSKMPQSKA